MYPVLLPHQLINFTVILSKKRKIHDSKTNHNCVTHNNPWYNVLKGSSIKYSFNYKDTLKVVGMPTINKFTANADPCLQWATPPKYKTHFSN